MSDLATIISVIDKFGRVMQNKNRTFRGADSFPGRGKMTRQNVGLAHPIIVEKSVCGLGIAPILAGYWNRAARARRELLKKYAESPAEP